MPSLAQRDNSLGRESPRDAVCHVTGGDLRRKWQGKARANTFLTPEQMKKDLETFSAVLEAHLIKQTPLQHAGAAGTEPGNPRPRSRELSQSARKVVIN